MSVGSQLPLLLSQAAHTPETFDAEAILDGVGTIVPDGRNAIDLSVSLDAAGSFATDAQTIEGPVVQLGGTGTFGAASQQTLVANATLNGVGGFTGSTTTLLNATLTGDGGVGAYTMVNRDTYRNLVWSAAPVAYWRLGERYSNQAGQSTGTPAFRSSVAVTPGGSYSTYPITIPSDVQVGDRLLLAFATTSAMTHTTPTGWTLLNSSVGGGTYGCRQSIFWRVAQLGDAGTSVTCTISSSGNLTLVMAAYSGVATINTSGASTSSGDSYPIVAPSVTTTVDGCRIVEFFAILGTYYTTLTYPAVQRANVTTGYSTSGASDYVQTGAGTTVQRTAATEYAGSWVGHTIALAAPVTGGAPPTVAQDEMGHYNGAYVETVGGATSAIRNSGDGALTLDGGTGYVALGNPAGLRITGAFTVEAWFKTTSTATQSIVGSYPKGFRIYLSNGTVYGYLWSTYYAGWIGMGNATVVADGKWHYVAFSYDGNRVFRVWVDDGPNASSDYGVALAVQHDPSGAFAIGRRGDSATEFLNGSVDEVAIYDRYLTDDELKSHGARRVYQSGWKWGPNLGTPRQQSAGVVGDGTYLYVMGGYYSGSRTEHEVYLSQYNIWTTKASVGYGTYDQGVAYMPSPPAPPGGYVYHAGGYNTNTYFFRYSINTNTWTNLPYMPYYDYGHQLVAVPSQNKLYVMGRVYGYVIAYDVAAGTWSGILAYMPMTNYMQRAAYYPPDGKIYLHYGYTLYQFDPVTYTFTAKANSIGYFASGHAFVVYNDRIWAMGGTDASGYSSKVVNSYDPITNTWQAEDDLLSGTQYFNGGLVSGNKLMVASGALGSSPYGVGGLPNRSEVYVPAATTGQISMSMEPSLMPYPVGRVALEIDLDLESEGEKIGGVRGLTAGPVRVLARDSTVYLSAYVEGTSGATARFPGIIALESQYQMYPRSGMSGTLGPIWQKIVGSEVPLPAADDPNIYVGDGDQSEAPTSIDEYAYATTDGGRYFYLASGWWWDRSWAQWWSNRLYRWDMEDQVWTELAALPGYVGSEGCTGGIIDGKFYVIMGDSGDTDIEPFGEDGVAPDPEWLSDADYLQSMWVYDIAADTWERGTQPPHAQDYGCSTVFDGKLYHSVGYDEVTKSKWFQVYDPVLDTWTRLADLPWFPAGTNSNMWVGDGKIWIEGTFSATLSYTYPGTIKVFSYNVGTDVWTDETSLFTGIPVLSGTWPYGDVLYASAVLPISSTVVWLVGGQGMAGTYEVDVVAKTLTKLDLSALDNMGWIGGGVYGTTKYFVGLEPTGVYTTT
jgi:hypothetical protein